MVRLLLASVGYDRAINILQKLVVVHGLVRQGIRDLLHFGIFLLLNKFLAFNVQTSLVESTGLIKNAIT